MGYSPVAISTNETKLVLSEKEQRLSPFPLARACHASCVPHRDPNTTHPITTQVPAMQASLSVVTPVEGGTLGMFGWGSAAKTLKLSYYTRPVLHLHFATLF